MKCPCGYTRFGSRVTRFTEAVSRWMRTSAGAVPGAGVTPGGCAAGTSVAGGWGRFEVSLTYGMQQVYCESCKRTRRAKRVGGVAPLGSYELDGALWIIAADVVRPVTCFEAHFISPVGVVYVVPIQVVDGTPPEIVATPVETAATLPPGAVVASQLLSAGLPEVQDSGTYSVDLVDRCASTRIPITNLYLEANVQVLVPQLADIGGAPRLWLQDHNVNLAEPSQQAGNAVPTIPFDKCTGVLEYDSRLGTLPNSQGWTLGGAGTINDYGIVDGRALRISTVATSHWTKALTLSTNPGRVHGYIHYRRGVFGATRGLDLQALYATNGAAWRGARVNARDAGVFKMELDAGASSALGIAGRPTGWESLGGSQVTSGPGIAWRDDYAEDATAVYGTVGTAGATEIRAIFGDTNGDSITGYIRRVIVSAPGRFIRAAFNAYADVASPVLRFGLSRVADADTQYSARFKVTYGQNADPYSVQPSTVSFTATLSAPNTRIEVSAALPGLSPQQPFWFTVERDWSHGDDLFDSTVHLHYVTVRSR